MRGGQQSTSDLLPQGNIALQECVIYKSGEEHCPCDEDRQHEPPSEVAMYEPVARFGKKRILTKPNHEQYEHEIRPRADMPDFLSLNK